MKLEQLKCKVNDDIVMTITMIMLMVWLLYFMKLASVVDVNVTKHDLGKVICGGPWSSRLH